MLATEHGHRLTTGSVLCDFLAPQFAPILLLSVCSPPHLSGVPVVGLYSSKTWLNPSDSRFTVTANGPRKNRPYNSSLTAKTIVLDLAPDSAIAGCLD